jgi:hypothetical protein
MTVVHGISDVECSVCWGRSGGNWTRRFRLFAGPGASPQVDEVSEWPAGWLAFVVKSAALDYCQRHYFVLQPFY